MKKISTEWKQEFSTQNFDTHSEFISLFDLLFYQVSDSTIYTRLSSTYNESDHDSYSKGKKLEHSIICFDEDLYNDRGNIKAGENQNEKWLTSGFDIAIPKIDLRAKPLFLTQSSFQSLTGVEDTYFSLQSFISTFKPRKLDSSDYFYSGEEDFSHGIKIFKQDALKAYYYVEDFINETVYKNNDDTSAKPLVTYDTNDTLEEDYSNVRMNADIILCEQNINFENKFLTSESHKKAFNSICVNYKNPKIWKSFCKYYNLTYTGSYNYVNFVTVEDDDKVIMTPTMEFLLKNCYFLIRFPVFADIVDYKDFDQSLNKTSRVIHNNLILTKNGDFNRFDKFEGNTSENAKNTRPYFPQTTPIVDLVAKDLLNKLQVANATNIQKINALITDSEKLNTDIGSIPTETFEQLSSNADPSFTSNGRNAPVPLWFDPYSRKDASEYGDLPILFSKDGNMILDGRIISKSIDEIWMVIKMLLSGRASDSATIDEIGYPKGTEQNESTNDTRPFIRKHTFKIGSNVKVGDPLMIAYQDGENLDFNVESWVNDPTEITYKLLNTFTQLTTSLGKSIDDIDESIKAGKSNPAANPYSLRELEALIRGLQYNLESFISYTSQFYAKGGATGHVDETNKNKAIAGSLYTLHKEYGVNNRKDTWYTGIDDLGQITNDMITNNQNEVPSYSVFLAADGKWHSVSQCMNIRIRDDEF